MSRRARPLLDQVELFAASADRAAPAQRGTRRTEHAGQRIVDLVSDVGGEPPMAASFVDWMSWACVPLEARRTAASRPRRDASSRSRRRLERDATPRGSSSA